MLKKFLPVALVAALAATAALPARADEASVKKAMEAKLGGNITSVTKTPYLDLYEVYADGRIIYTDEKQSVIIAGALIDGKTMQNHTAERMHKLTAIKFSDLPLEYAVKQVRGNGKRQVAVFEDPNCPICRVFTKFVDQLDDVTVYRFMYPVIDPSSQSLARTAWCAADRAGAWDQVMGGRRLAGPQECDVSGLVEILQFGEKHRIQNTPTVFLGNGKRLVGATPPEQFMAELEASARR